MSQDMRQLRIWLPAHSNEVIVTSLAAIEASQTATNHCRYIIRVTKSTPVPIYLYIIAEQIISTTRLRSIFNGNQLVNTRGLKLP